MKYAICLFLMIAPLSACGPGLFNFDKKTLLAVSPDVPEIDKDMQRFAAIEMKNGQCPALNNVANICLITRDEARILKK